MTKRGFLEAVRRALIAFMFGSGVGGAQAQGISAPSDGLSLTAEQQASISTRVRQIVWGGFETREGLLEIAHDHENPRNWTPDDDRWVAREVDRLQAEKFAAEASWPAVTDWDKLDAAFKQIEARKIVALHNAGNTLSDAVSDAFEVWQELGGPNSGLRGYIVYQSQDVDHVVADGQLHLGYGTFENDDEAGHKIAVEACGVLSAAGMKVTVPKDASTRILISGLDWKKRSPRE